jgi:integrase/recombinase XerD
MVDDRAKDTRQRLRKVAFVICPDCASKHAADQELIETFCRRRGGAKKWGEKTVFNYRAELSKYAVFLFAAGISLLEAEPSDLREFLKAGDTTDRNTAKELSMLRGFYRWLVKTGRLGFSPATFLRIKKTWSNKPRSRSEDEVKEILENAWKVAHEPNASPLEIRDWTLKEFFYASAVRRFECANIDLRNLDLKDLTVWVKGKGGSERTPQIDPRGVEAVKFYLKHARPKLRAKSGKAPSEALFLTRYGTRLSLATINRIVHEISPHVYRHSWAQHKANAGVSIKKISVNLGHREQKVTMIYVPAVPFEELQEAHRQFHPSERDRPH